MPRRVALVIVTGLLFIFDMDDVLYDYDWRKRMRGMSELVGLDFAELRSRWWHHDGEWAAEAGHYRTGEEYFAAFTAAIGVEVAVEDWVRIRAGAMTAWPDSIAAVRRAAELGQVTLLTNNGALAGQHLATLAPELGELFGEHLLTSSFYGARKPDPVVFERVLEKYAIPAARAFFADDLPENVAGAASIGIDAHLFTTPAELLAAIERFAAARAHPRCVRARTGLPRPCAAARLSRAGADARQRRAVVARSRPSRSRWVATADQPSAARSARMSSPCTSPCSITSVPPGRSSLRAVAETRRTTSSPSSPP